MGVDSFAEMPVLQVAWLACGVCELLAFQTWHPLCISGTSHGMASAERVMCTRQLLCGIEVAMQEQHAHKMGVIDLEGVQILAPNGEHRGAFGDVMWQCVHGRL